MRWLQSLHRAVTCHGRQQADRTARAAQHQCRMPVVLGIGVRYQVRCADLAVVAERRDVFGIKTLDARGMCAQAKPARFACADGQYLIGLSHSAHTLRSLYCSGMGVSRTCSSRSRSKERSAAAQHSTNSTANAAFPMSPSPSAPAPHSTPVHPGTATSPPFGRRSGCI